MPYSTYSEFIWIFEEVTSPDSLEEGLVDIKVIPFFGTSLAPGLEAMLFGLVFKLILGNRVGCGTSHVTLCAHQDDGSIAAHLANLSLPLVYRLEGVLIVDSYAEKEAVRLVEDNLAVHTQMRISTCVMDFKLNLFTIELLGTSEDVEDIGLVVIGEDLLLIVDD